MQGWRKYLSSLDYSQHADVYEFGIYSGNSVNWINQSLKVADKNIRKIFGFDSFCGLPKETEQEREAVIAERGVFQWSAGDFSAQELFGVKNTQDAMNAIHAFVESTLGDETSLELIPGYYSDSLTDDIVEKYDMQPACYVDLDADLYLSTISALDFLFRNKLIRAGTFVGYDDWGGTPGWETMEDGVSKAHVEMAEKYNAEFQLIGLSGSGYPHIQTMFKVRSVG